MVWNLGKRTLSDVTGLSMPVLYLVLAALALVLFGFLEKRSSAG